MASRSAKRARTDDAADIPSVKDLWAKSSGPLKSNGWHYVKGKGTVDFYYLRPGVPKPLPPFVLGQHYFDSEIAMYEWVCNNWRGQVWKQRVVLAPETLSTEAQQSPSTVAPVRARPTSLPVTLTDSEDDSSGSTNRGSGKAQRNHQSRPPATPAAAAVAAGSRGSAAATVRAAVPSAGTVNAPTPAAAAAAAASAASLREQSCGSTSSSSSNSSSSPVRSSGAGTAGAARSASASPVVGAHATARVGWHAMGSSRKDAHDAAVDACRSAIKNHCLITSSSGDLTVRVTLAVPAPTDAVNVAAIQEMYPKFTDLQVVEGGMQSVSEGNVQATTYVAIAYMQLQLQAARP